MVIQKNQPYNNEESDFDVLKSRSQTIYALCRNSLLPFHFLKSNGSKTVFCPHDSKICMNNHRLTDCSFQVGIYVLWICPRFKPKEGE